MSRLSKSSVDADSCQHCKYLSHIAEGADVVFVKADVEGVVGAEGLRAFEEVIKARHMHRREKEGQVQQEGESTRGGTGAQEAGRRLCGRTIQIYYC
jgi:hypothetical protein